MLTSTARSNKSLLLVYAGLLAVAIVSFLGIVAFGEGLYASGVSTPSATHLARPAAATSLHLLRALITLLLTASLLGALCRRIRQPPVIGEILAGICLGPSLLGQIAPSVQHYLIPLSVAPQLGTLSQIGVILFMFLVGLDLDTSLMQTNSHSTLAISHASIVVPFVLGSVAAIWLYPSFGTSTASFTIFALFLGVSLSVTAFPVLARILTDNSLNRSTMGVVALTCAAVDDVTAWCLLAILVGVAKANTSDAILTCVVSLLYVATLLWLVRPAVRKWTGSHERRSQLPRAAVTVVVVALLVSSLITEQIGIHAIFGAFLLGAIIPHDSKVAQVITGKFHDLVVVLFMPAFYALTGMRTQLALVKGWGQWLTCGLIIVLACVGKFGGSYLAARAVGVERRDAASIGILMNTRGLMELVVLDLGLDLGVISPTLFAMMVTMALVTTFLTSPLLRLTHGFATSAERADDPLLFGAAAAGAHPRTGT